MPAPGVRIERGTAGGGVPGWSSDGGTGKVTEMAAANVDALVIFGATGDLAKLWTFPALVGLVEPGVPDVPVIGWPRAAGAGAVPRLRLPGCYPATSRRHGLMSRRRSPGGSGQCRGRLLQFVSRQLFAEAVDHHPRGRDDKDPCPDGLHARVQEEHASDDEARVAYGPDPAVEPPVVVGHSTYGSQSHHLCSVLPVSRDFHG